MNINDRIKYAREKGKESAERIFKEKPEEIKKILEEETTLGRPENLLDRSDENEPKEFRISYRCDEEKDFLLFYARRLNHSRALDILDKGYVSDAEEAEILSRFFWQMVDQAVEDDKLGIESPFSSSSEFWCEKTLGVLSGYLNRAGYETIWDQVSDEQDR